MLCSDTKRSSEIFSVDSRDSFQEILLKQSLIQAFQGLETHSWESTWRILLVLLLDQIKKCSSLSTQACSILASKEKESSKISAGSISPTSQYVFHWTARMKHKSSSSLSGIHWMQSTASSTCLAPKHIPRASVKTPHRAVWRCYGTHSFIQMF